MSTLIQASYCISALIFNLIDRSLSTGVVPQNLKTAVSPLLRNLAQFLPYLFTTGLFLISYLLRFWKKQLFHDCNLIQNLIISINHFNQVFLHFTAPRLHCSLWSLTSFLSAESGFLIFPLLLNLNSAFDTVFHKILPVCRLRSALSWFTLYPSDKQFFIILQRHKYHTLPSHMVFLKDLLLVLCSLNSIYFPLILSCDQS